MLARHISAVNKYKVSSQLLVQELNRLSSTGARVPRAFPNSDPALVRAETLLGGLLTGTRNAPSLPLQRGRHRTRDGTVHKFPFILDVVVTLSRRGHVSSTCFQLRHETYSQAPPPSVRTLHHQVERCVKFFSLPSSCHSHVICDQHMHRFVSGIGSAEVEYSATTWQVFVRTLIRSRASLLAPVCSTHFLWLTVQTERKI